MSGLLIVLALVMVIAAAAGFAVALAIRSRRDFAEQNRVVPGVDSPAPASWAGAHHRAARLHRRLRDAIAALHAGPRLVELGLAPQIEEVEREAVAIDERLVGADALPGSRRDAALDRIEPLVDLLDAAVAAIVEGATARPDSELLAGTVSDADIRLRALADARAEVERIDRGPSGTSSP